MNKIKKIWQENKILLVLAIILIICLVIFGVVAMTFFYGTSDSVYGHRLDNIKDVKISNELIDNIKSTLEENEKVKNVVVNLKGVIVYVNITFEDATKMEDAKKVADESLTLFSEEELGVYDIQFTITSASTEKFVGYSLMGARNSNGSGTIVWNNYNIEEEKSKN